jgi:F0F1-type ATP synthase assembly protein I
VLLITIADTTWRMFVPTIGFTIAGVALDNALPTKPWLTVAGVVIGATVALALVVRQLAVVRGGDE